MVASPVVHLVAAALQSLSPSHAITLFFCPHAMEHVLHQSDLALSSLEMIDQSRVPRRELPGAFVLVGKA